MGLSVNTWRRSGRLVPDQLEIETQGIPSLAEWERLRLEVDADRERRILISHEFVGQADDATAQRIVKAVGEPIHVCITLRPPSQIVPSLWAQGIRDDAQTESLESWLDRFYGRDVDHPLPERYRRANDQGEMVARWAGLVGSENVTVVVVDKTDPDRLSSSFEAMLGLPTGTLEWTPSNHSLAAVDAELFRRVNAILRDRGADWRTFYSLVRMGAIRLGPERRTVGPEEAKIVLPPWAAKLAAADGRRFAESIRGSRTRVVGDLDALTAEHPATEWQDVDSLSVDVAADAVAAAVMAGQESRVRFTKTVDSLTAEISCLQDELTDATSWSPSRRDQRFAAEKRAEQMATAFSTRELAAALKRRLLYRLRTRRSHQRSPGSSP